MAAAHAPNWAVFTRSFRGCLRRQLCKSYTARPLAAPHHAFLTMTSTSTASDTSMPMMDSTTIVAESKVSSLSQFPAEPLRNLQTHALSTSARPDSTRLPSRKTAKPPGPLSDNIKMLLPLLKSQAPHYITAHIWAKSYLLTAGDTLRLPFWMHGVNPGDVLRLNCASSIGSRDYTLKAGAKPKLEKGSHIPGGNPDKSYLDDRLFVCRATVLGSVYEPERKEQKTKRRQRKIKTVKSKHRYTLLKISELTIRGVDEIEGDERSA